MQYTKTDNRKVKTKSAYAAVRKLEEWSQLDNVADILDKDDLNRIGEIAVREYNVDKASRAKWEEEAKKGLDAVDLEAESKNYPWQGAANVKYPLLAEAALQFNARSYPAIVQDQIVKCKVFGHDPDGQKAKRGRRVAEYMSYMLSNRIECWEGDTDTMLSQLPVVGHAFRKVFPEPRTKEIRSELVNALNLVVNNKTKDLSKCPRATQDEVFYYPHEIQDFVRQDLFVDHDYGCVGGDQDDDAPHEFLEQHRLLDLDGDGYREPWIITVHKATAKVARIEAGYFPEDIDVEVVRGREVITSIKRKVEFISYPFLPDPKGGFYGVGFGKLIAGLVETINSSLNQMLDAGHLQNAGGGFIGSGLRLKSSVYRQEPGKYHTVSSAGTDIRQAIYNFDHPGPSPVLFQLLGFLENAAKGITTIQDAMTGEMNRNAPVGTTLALIEQGMKVFNATYKRVYRSLRKELNLIYRLNGIYADPFAYQTFFDVPDISVYDDFDDQSMDIVPVADPNTVLDMQRIQRGQLILENAKDPQLAPYHNMEQALRSYYELVRIDNIDDILQTPEPDPMQQQMTDIQMSKETAEVDKTRSETEKNLADAMETKLETEAKVFGLELDDAFSSMTETLQ